MNLKVYYNFLKFGRSFPDKADKISLFSFLSFNINIYLSKPASHVFYVVKQHHTFIMTDSKRNYNFLVTLYTYIQLIFFYPIRGLFTLSECKRVFDYGKGV